MLCFSVCLYLINTKTSETVEPNFCAKFIYIIYIEVKSFLITYKTTLSWKETKVSNNLTNNKNRRSALISISAILGHPTDYNI